jgi:hemerythrin
MTIGWDDSLATGNELIDRQHREVFGLLGELRMIQDAPESEAHRVLDAFMEFSAVHFVSEEQLMTQVGYPAAPTAEMIAEHKEFTDYARERVIMFRFGDRTSLLSLHAFLFDWLKEHEVALDQLLADWIRAQNGTSTAEARTPVR